MSDETVTDDELVQIIAWDDATNVFAEHSNPDYELLKVRLAVRAAKVAKALQAALAREREARAGLANERELWGKLMRARQAWCQARTQRDLQRLADDVESAEQALRDRGVDVDGLLMGDEAARDTLNKAKSTDSVIGKLDTLTASERLAVFSEYCTHCGDKNPRCPCWNDE